MSDARISQDNDDIRKFLWYHFIIEGNSFLGRIATSVIGNEVEKMTGNDISNLARRTKLYQQEHQLNSGVKVRLVLFLTSYFKG